MNHRYLAGLAAGTLGLMLAATPSAQAAPSTPTDIFYGSVNPTFTGAVHYLSLQIFGSDATGAFLSTNSANYVFGDETDPLGLANKPFFNDPFFIGNGVTQYFSYTPTYSVGCEPASPFLDYGLASYDVVGVTGNLSAQQTGFVQGSFAYTYGTVANYPDILNFNLGDPVAGSLSLQQNNPFATGVPEIDADSAALPLMLMLGGIAVSERRRRRPLEESSDEE